MVSPTRKAVRLLRFCCLLAALLIIAIQDDAELAASASSPPRAFPIPPSSPPPPLPEWTIVLFADGRFWPRLERSGLQIRDPFRGNYQGGMAVVAIGENVTDSMLAATARRLDALPVRLAPINDSFLYAATNNFRAHERGPGSGFQHAGRHDDRQWTKRAQWQKLQIFDPFWLGRARRILYLDAGVQVFLPLQPALEKLQDDVDAGYLVAPYDGGFTIDQQLDREVAPEGAYATVLSMCGGVHRRGFMTTVFAFRPDALIEGPGTLAWLTGLMNDLRIWYTNEQALLNVAYGCDKVLWRLPWMCEGAADGADPPCLFAYDPMRSQRTGADNCTSAVFMKYRLQSCEGLFPPEGRGPGG